MLNIAKQAKSVNTKNIRIAVLLALLFLNSYFPLLAMSATEAAKAAKIPPPARPAKIKKGPRVLKKISPVFRLSQNPSDNELQKFRGLPVPLASVGTANDTSSSKNDNANLAKALSSLIAQKQKTAKQDPCPFEGLREKVKRSKMVASKLKDAGNEQIKVASTA